MWIILFRINYSLNVRPVHQFIQLIIHKIFLHLFPKIWFLKNYFIKDIYTVQA